MTVPVTTSGFNDTGASLIGAAKAAGLDVTSWSGMTFEFGGGDMTTKTMTAVDAEAQTVASVYGMSRAEAYTQVGMVSFAGVNHDLEKSDPPGPSETLTPANFTTLLAYAQQHHLSRFSFWNMTGTIPAVERGRPETTSAAR